MAQTYYATVVSMSYLPGGGITPETTKIKSIDVNVSDRSSGSFVPVTDLIDLNFRLWVNGNEFNMVNNWTMTPSDAQGGNYKINFNSTREPNGNDYIIIIVQRSTTTSNRLFIDCSVLFSDTGEAQVENYKIMNPGEYYFLLNNVDGAIINKPSQYSYKFVNAPSEINSSISPVNLTPGVSYVIPEGGLNVPVKIVLKDANNNPISGTNQISMFAALK